VIQCRSTVPLSCPPPPPLLLAPLFPFSLSPRPPPPSLFPYTTLFRSTHWPSKEYGDKPQDHRQGDTRPNTANHASVFSYSWVQSSNQLSRFWATASRSTVMGYSDNGAYCSQSSGSSTSSRTGYMYISSGSVC